MTMMICASMGAMLFINQTLIIVAMWPIFYYDRKIYESVIENNYTLLVQGTFVCERVYVCESMYVRESVHVYECERESVYVCAYVCLCICLCYRVYMKRERERLRTCASL